MAKPDPGTANFLRSALSHIGAPVPLEKLAWCLKGQVPEEVVQATAEDMVARGLLQKTEDGKYCLA
jgi:hypothetical protein